MSHFGCFLFIVSHLHGGHRSPHEIREKSTLHTHAKHHESPGTASRKSRGRAALSPGRQILWRYHAGSRPLGIEPPPIFVRPNLQHAPTRAGTNTALDTHVMPGTSIDLDPVLTETTAPAQAKPPPTVRTRFSEPPSAHGRAPHAYRRVFRTGAAPMACFLILSTLLSHALDGGRPTTRLREKNTRGAKRESDTVAFTTVRATAVFAMSFVDSVHRWRQLSPPRAALSGPHDVQTHLLYRKQTVWARLAVRAGLLAIRRFPGSIDTPPCLQNTLCPTFSAAAMSYR